MRPLPTLALILVLLGTLVGVPATDARASTTVAERYPVPVGGTVSLAGHGYGHGKGLSQWGARGAASQGVGYRQILDFYYPGTVSRQDASTPLRVWIKADTDNDVRVLAVPDMTVSDGVNSGVPISTKEPFASATQWRIVHRGEAGGTGFYLEALSAGRWVRWSNGASPSHMTLATPSGNIRLVLPNGTQKDYLGTMRAVSNGTAAPGLISVNVVDMEQYLRSVVPGEMPSSWPADALRSQTVAARTYAAFDRAANARRAYDTCDTTQCQVYPGLNTFSSSGVRTATHVTTSTDQAVAATAREVRHYQGALAFTQFSSSNGGWTAEGDFAYQRAAKDPWDGAIPNNANHWSARITTASIASAYPKIGTPRSIEVTRRTGNGEWGGAVESVTIHGTSSSATVTGSAFRSAFGLKSTWWKVTASPRLESDVSGDGLPDVLAVTGTGALRAYTGNGRGAFGGVLTYGSGWDAMPLVVRAGDLTGNGRVDVLGTDSAGRLWRYPADGVGGFLPRAQVGSGWTSMLHLVAPGDLDGDGRADLLAVDASGALWSYAGNGSGGFGGRALVGSGWAGMRSVLGAGDLTSDGSADLLAITAAGDLLLYEGTGRGTFGRSQTVGSGWGAMTLVAPVSSWTATGRPTLLASDPAGDLWAYAWAGNGWERRVQAGNGWNAIQRLF